MSVVRAHASCGWGTRLARIREQGRGAAPDQICDVVSGWLEPPAAGIEASRDG